MLRQQGKQAHSSDPSTTTNVMSFSVEGLLEVLDRTLKYILSSLQVQLLLMRCLIYLLLATVHHFRISKRSGLVRLFGFSQMSRLRDEGRNESPCC